MDGCRALIIGRRSSFIMKRTFRGWEVEEIVVMLEVVAMLEPRRRREEVFMRELQGKNWML